MEINGEKVIGYDRIADRGLIIFTQSVNHAMGDCTHVRMAFATKQECDEMVWIARREWKKHIAELREGYRTIVK